MLREYSPLVQTLLGCLLTWGFTALGAVFCFLAPPKQPKHYSSKSQNQQNHNTHFTDLLLDGSLGFAAGVMVAASFWSLLVPAIDLSVEEFFSYETKHLAFIPPALGVILGAMFVYFVELVFPLEICPIGKYEHDLEEINQTETPAMFTPTADGVRQRRGSFPSKHEVHFKLPGHSGINKRLWMLIVAVTLHNIPEGAAVGISFAAAHGNQTKFESARSLAWGIALQNFPEGLAVSLPLRASGFSLATSFWYGQLSGLVEPVAGVVACMLMQFIHSLQPIALGFAAGAMLFVVFDDVMPEAQSKGNEKLASCMVIVGFITMMALDVGTS